MRFSSEHDKPIGFNLSAEFIIQFEKDNVMRALEYVDDMFCNEHEASKIAAELGLEEADRQGAAKHIAKSKKVNEKRPRVVIMT